MQLAPPDCLPQNQHWNSTRLCSISTSVLSVHQWLHIQPILHQDGQVADDSPRPHQGQWWVGLWKQMCHNEYRKQPGLEIVKEMVEMVIDFQKLFPLSTAHQQRSHKGGGVCLVCGCYHHQRPETGDIFIYSHQESSPKDVNPQTAMKDEHLLKHPQQVLQRHQANISVSSPPQSLCCNPHPLPTQTGTHCANSQLAHRSGACTY